MIRRGTAAGVRGPLGLGAGGCAVGFLQLEVAAALGDLWVVRGGQPGDVGCDGWSQQRDFVEATTASLLVSCWALFRIGDLGASFFGEFGKGRQRSRRCTKSRGGRNEVLTQDGPD